MILALLLLTESFSIFWGDFFRKKSLRAVLLIGLFFFVGGSKTNQVVNSDGELILDTRSPAAFDRGHIPRALNIPYGDLFDKTTNLFKTRHELMQCNAVKACY